VLTCAVGSASKRSLIVLFTASGPVPCSGARRRDKVLDVVSTAIHGGAAAVNNILNSFLLIPGNSKTVNIRFIILLTNLSDIIALIKLFNI
jgi:hypothetical protein